MLLCYSTKKFGHPGNVMAVHRLHARLSLICTDQGLIWSLQVSYLKSVQAVFASPHTPKMVAGMRISGVVCMTYCYCWLLLLLPPGG
jgi:hypothetical protein